MQNTVRKEARAWLACASLCISARYPEPQRELAQFCCFCVDEELCAMLSHLCTGGARAAVSNAFEENGCRGEEHARGNS